MKLQIELTWYGGLISDGDDDFKKGAEYHLYDADTGRSLCDQDFSTSEELEAYITDHYPDCERWVPPPAPPDEFARLMAMLGLYDGGILDNPVIKRVARNSLINNLYQSSYPDDIVARARSVIDNLKE